MPAYVNGIKYIHAGKSSDIAWGQLTPPKRNPASVLCKPLTATTVPTMPIKNHANSAGQVHTARPVPSQKDLLLGNICLGTADPWGLLTPVVSQSVRGQENTEQSCTVTMRDHYIKTLIQSPELRFPLMEIDSRTIIYNDYNRLDTIYSPVCHNYRRTLSNGHRYTHNHITICYSLPALLWHQEKLNEIKALKHRGTPPPPSSPRNVSPWYHYPSQPGLACARDHQKKYKNKNAKCVILAISWTKQSSKVSPN